MQQLPSKSFLSLSGSHSPLSIFRLTPVNPLSWTSDYSFSLWPMDVSSSARARTCVSFIFIYLFFTTPNSKLTICLSFAPMPISRLSLARQPMPALSHLIIWVMDEKMQKPSWFSSHILRWCVISLTRHLLPGDWLTSLIFALLQRELILPLIYHKIPS